MQLKRQLRTHARYGECNMNKKLTIFDVETAPNKCMVGFKDIATGKVKQFDSQDSKKIAKYIQGRTLIGYNNINYDNVMVTAMMRGKSTKQLYKMSVDLIEHDGKHWNYPNFIKSYIDLIEVVVGQASLKLYGSRLNTKKLQDLPYDPHTKHTKKMWKDVCEYNINDLDLTLELYEFLQPQLKLRAEVGKKYKVDVMSKGEAQIATSIYNELLGLKNIPKQKIPKYVEYKAPDYIKFKSKELNNILDYMQDTVFEVNQNSGQPIKPKDMPNVEVGGVEYELGLGGIHAKVKSISIIPKDDEVLEDVDVASQYPSMMIENGFYPKQIDVEFGKVFENIYTERQEAKKIESDIK